MKGLTFLVMALLAVSLLSTLALAKTQVITADSNFVPVAPAVNAQNEVATPSDIIVATPSISTEEVEAAATAVAEAEVVIGSSGIESDYDYAVGLPIALTGIGEAVNTQGKVEAIEIAEVAQIYSDRESSGEGIASKGTLVIAQETYSIELKSMSESEKVYSVLEKKSEVGELKVTDIEGGFEGTLVIEGESYEVNVFTESRPLKVPEEETVITKIKNFFTNLFRGE